MKKGWDDKERVGNVGVRIVWYDLEGVMRFSVSFNKVRERWVD